MKNDTDYGGSDGFKPPCITLKPSTPQKRLGVTSRRQIRTRKKGKNGKTRITSKVAK